MIRIKRAYEAVSENDGLRILVDRLWPRGVSKEAASIDVWLKEVAPSNELRTWFNHDPAKWMEFKKRYLAELKEKPQVISQLTQLIQSNQIVTLVFAAKDTKHNNAVVLQEMLKYLN